MYVDMPDLMENIDVLASLRGAQDILFDLLDEPDMIGERIQEVTDVYYEYYDRFYDIIKDEERRKRLHCIPDLGTWKNCKTYSAISLQ